MHYGPIKAILRAWVTCMQVSEHGKKEGKKESSIYCKARVLRFNFILPNIEGSGLSRRVPWAQHSLVTLIRVQRQQQKTEKKPRASEIDRKKERHLKI